MIENTPSLLKYIWLLMFDLLNDLLSDLLSEWEAEWVNDCLIDIVTDYLLVDYFNDRDQLINSFTYG